MKHLRARIPLLLVLGLLATGCTTRGKLAERTHLSRHPIHETRMSSQLEEGYQPSGVWKIRGAQNIVYLVGTCHVIPQDQIPFPSPFYAAYQDSKEIYVEFDTVSWFQQLRLLPKAFSWVWSHQNEFRYPKGKTLDDDLSPQTIQRLRTFYGKDFHKMQGMTPLFLAFMAEATDGGQDGQNGGVEDIFNLLARQNGKPVHALDGKEIVDTAFATLDELLLQLHADIAKRGADAVVEEHVLSNENDMSNEDWRRGNLAASDAMQAEMKSEAPAMYEKLLVERNRKWLPKLKRALQGKNNVMVLVGFAHLGGKDGLLQMLQEAGFPAEQMYGVDRPLPTSQ